MGKKNTFMRNASFLMIATMISRVIGLLYRGPLRATIGGVGIGYYGYASTVYATLLLISSYSIPMAISKVVSERLALKQYRNAYMVFKGALIYALVVGGIAGSVALFGGKLLLPANQWEAILPLKILGPTIFMSAILGVLRGYFQAYNTMLPTSISQILEQIANAVVSVVAAVLFIKAFAVDEKGRAIYGAAGATLGTGAGVVVGLVFMIFVYMINRKTINRQVVSDRNHKQEALGDVFKIITLMVTPVIFSTFVYNASTYLDSYLFSVLMGRGGIDKELISSLYGEFSNCYIPIIGIPLALSSASSSAMLPEVSALYIKNDIDGVIQKIHTAIRLTMFICIPAAVGLAALAYPIMRGLFPGSTAVSGDLLLLGAVSVIFSALSTITNGVLQAIGKPRIPLRNAAIALALNLLVLTSLLWFSPKLGIYAVLLVSVLFSFSMCILNQFSLKKYLGYQNQFRESYEKPFLAAVGMGVTAWILYYGLQLVIPIKIIPLGIAIMFAVVVYLVLFVVITKTSEDELRRFPMGNYAVKFMKVIRVYK